MAEISILLPSLRPAAALKVVGDFSLTHPRTDYEIIVVSPFAMTGKKVVHLLEKERRGVLYAINRAYQSATGELIVVWSDDATPTDGCLDRMANFVKSHEGFFVAGFRKKNRKGKEAEQWSVYGKLYVGWLCASKKTLEAAGGLFDPAFTNFWADPDLCLRVWSRGGIVAVCPDAWITVDQVADKVKAENLNASFDTDTKTFFDRWHDKLGGRSKRVWADINVPIPCSFGGRLQAWLKSVPLVGRALTGINRLLRKMLNLDPSRIRVK